MMFAARENEKTLRYWENCGGATTINSYRFGGSINDILPEHCKLLEEARPYYETEDYIFTHANYLPDVPMSMQPDYQLRWALFEADKMRPHESGKTVFVGHTEQVDGEVLDLGFATCIDTACWKNGWLTAMDAATRSTWQASRWGMLREVDEPSQSLWLSKHFRAGKAQAVGATH
jgi:serine/threonine protein phosphatase 1